MDYMKFLKDNPLPYGLFMICGEQGAGKTSFVTALLRTDYKYWHKWRYKQAQGLAQQFYKDSGVRLQISETLYFSNIDILLNRRTGVHTWDIEMNKLGLPNDDFEVQYLPCGSVVFITEGDLLAYAREWADINVYLRALAKFCRHNKITILIDLQADSDLESSLRKLVVGEFYMTCTGIKRFLLFWKRQCWEFLYLKTQLIAKFETLSKFGLPRNLRLYENGKFHIPGNVFDCYDSFSGLRYFLYKIEQVGYKYIPHTKNDLSLKSIAEYCKAHPLARPEEMKKPSGSSRNKQGYQTEKPQRQPENYNPF